MIPVTSPAYAAIDREAIWAALFAWLKQKLGNNFKSIGRKHIAPPDLTIANQPALFQVAAKEIHIPQKTPGMPSRLVLRGFLVLYIFDDSPVEMIGSEKVLGETRLNKLLQAIDGALVPDDPSSGKFTIGGKVAHCWIEGDSDLDPGIFGPQTAAILPINILV
jgi:hypothetical protein